MIRNTLRLNSVTPHPLKPTIRIDGDVVIGPVGGHILIDNHVSNGDIEVLARVSATNPEIVTGGLVLIQKPSGIAEEVGGAPVSGVAGREDKAHGPDRHRDGCL